MGPMSPMSPMTGVCQVNNSVVKEHLIQGTTVLERYQAFDTKPTTLSELYVGVFMKEHAHEQTVTKFYMKSFSSRQAHAREQDLTNIVFAWRLGKVMDVASARSKMHESQHAELDKHYRLTVNVNVNILDANKLQRIFIMPTGNSKDT